MSHASRETLAAYMDTLDSATLVRDLVALGDWTDMGPENRTLRRVIIDALCDRHPEVDATVGLRDGKQATIAAASYARPVTSCTSSPGVPTDGTRLCETCGNELAAHCPRSLPTASWKSSWTPTVPANWRLTADTATTPGSVRLGCWHTPTPPPARCQGTAGPDQRVAPRDRNRRRAMDDLLPGSRCTQHRRTQRRTQPTRPFRGRFDIPPTRSRGPRVGRPDTRPAVADTLTAAGYPARVESL